MPEERWAMHGGSPACDLCHARKIKCDRQDPCKNCVNSAVQCLRTRQKRAPQQREKTGDKIKALIEKLTSLEDVVRTAGRILPPHSTPDPSTSVSTRRITSNAPPSINDDPSPRPSKRPRSSATPSASATSLSTSAHAHHEISPHQHSDPVTSQVVNGGARDHIQKELSSNESLAAHQRNVFEMAISFIDQLSHAPTGSGEEETCLNAKVNTEFAKEELISLVVACQGIEGDRGRLNTQLFELDHIPSKALERMAFVLLDGTADERTLNLCKIIVHFKAGLGLYASQLHKPRNAQLKEHIKEMQLRHLSAALTALDAISFMVPPSLLLLQALLTGAILFYIVGNSSSCWSLTAYASRTLVALGYHNISQAQLSTPKSEQEQEIHAVVAWTYHFDRCMSLLLLRPASLPPLRVPVSSLVSFGPENPMAIFALVMLELVPIHEKILELTLAGQQRRVETGDAEPQVTEMRRKMDDILLRIEQARAKCDAADSPDYQLHWHSLEFKYFSTLTAVHRLSHNICFYAPERERCLYAARQALQCVKEIRNLALQQDHFVEEYSPYLAWTILSYPIAPFYVLFCNVVGTSDTHDFQLLQDVVESISSLVIENKHVDRLRRLCNTLLTLCRPLAHSDAQSHPAVVQGGQSVVASNAPNEDATPNGVQSTRRIEAAGMEGMRGEGMGSGERELWQDDMMSQLLSVQPSLDWFNSDILDPASWDLNLPS
ncbi:hypothetical protein BU23DRAFT_186123 [Bimuria novae-zelandiae CBS 107.79]|uniref:Zn(2)-C6 fungal-type domain-containing protein n=1 Tax=Bimuria novae-zelandiae CBS 107.79 TaxID=1447943 RepID=A0A6A5V1K6_9PLEO|nr:hypothetical protein BU23DRAFT_186123 [Bimuria novae-zelandiae CBS 107.79]